MSLLSAVASSHQISFSPCVLSACEKWEQLESNGVVISKHHMVNKNFKESSSPI